jgi:hypothetical protein
MKKTRAGDLVGRVSGDALRVGDDRARKVLSDSGCHPWTPAITAATCDDSGAGASEGLNPRDSGGDRVCQTGS